ncbi:rod shape-determining protein [Helicobacter turcicus]|uniref:Rod shape-determining protein n=1 Tax=Helicobacter turcicus TaxID=2867412 RepID=A0ABS7JND3_9HELI|nr:rod shape-determining protein [Helicobacter turcicus]MBX7490919.1 rod shape-determining protein [Helicobacter turcicus]MBX7545773.1 rod shape-determining protein [Helicobacter turcicus]
MALFDRNDIAVDLGTVNTIVRNDTDNVLFCEATCIAIENKYNSTHTLAIGNNAKKMLGRTPQDINVINPLLNGAISDFETTKIFMQALIERGKTNSLAPRVGISIPQNLTQVERHSLYEATMFAGAKEVLLIEDPFSASVGAGLDISTSRAKMIIDAGGGLVEASIISLGGLVTSAYTKEAGDFIDYAIIEFCRYNKNIGISKDIAERIKHTINVFSDNPNINIGAKNLVNGMPIAYELQLNDFKNLLLNSMEKIKSVILEAINEAPPQIAPDLIDDGAVLTGGLALMQGLRDYLEEELKIAINLSPDPLQDISKGAYLIMENYANYEQGL